MYLTTPDIPSLGTRTLGTLAVLGGILLMIGFRSKSVGSAIGLGIAAISLSWLPAPAVNLFDSLLPAVLTETMTAAVVLLGPGAYSADARMFGRREEDVPSVVEGEGG